MRHPSIQIALRTRVPTCLLAALLAACQPDLPSDGRDLVTATLSRPGSPFELDVRLYQLPPGLRDLNHVTYGLQMGRDGYLYLGIGDNQEDGHLLRFDPASGTFEDLGSILAAVPEAARASGNFGKFHVGPWQAADGSVYFASYPREHWPGEPTGRLLRYRADTGIVDLGPTPGNEGAYFMHGDADSNRLCLALRNSHFVVYDIATASWRDLGRFTSKSPFIGLTDPRGRLYVFGYDGTGNWVPGPPTISRYDPVTDRLETSRDAPPTLWVGAVTPDGDVAYTTSYERAELYRWRLSDWPDYETEELGHFDPAGRPVFSNNLSLAPGDELLVLAGTIDSRDRWLLGHIHGIWVYDIRKGEKTFAAELNEVLTESFGADADRVSLYWTGANIVDSAGWIYAGVHSLPSDSKSRARLLAIQVRRKAGNE